MIKKRGAGWGPPRRRSLLTLVLLAFLFVFYLLVAANSPAVDAAADSIIRPSAAVTWHVTRPGDSETDGDLGAHAGTLRFVLAHAAAGDFVSFADFDTAADRIYAGSPLAVPDGVAVGILPQQGCGDYTHPVAVIEALTTTVNPVLSVGAGASVRGLNITGGDISVRVTGAGAEVCGVGLGVEYDEDGVLVTRPPWHAALVIDAPGAAVHSSFINGPMVVTPLGSDSRIGDALAGTGQANRGGCGNQGKCALTIMADPSMAARRVTVRDPFPRVLSGMPGSGVWGGDDDPIHANNWAGTPAITRAVSYDNFATVEVIGSANPLSLVDLFYNDGISLQRQTPVSADASGKFLFTGNLPGHTLHIFAVSTLMDPAFPDRVGSSSALSVGVPVSAETSGEPALAADASIAVVGRPGSAGASVGDQVRFSVALENTGGAPLTDARGMALVLPAGFQAVPGSGVVTGGSGFSADETGFSGGTLARGQRATYSVDLAVTPQAVLGRAVISIQVGATDVIALPLSAAFDVLGRWVFPLVCVRG